MKVNVKPWLEGLKPYTPPSSTGARVRLDLNEFPWPPPQSVLKAAMEALGEANRYPRRELYEAVLEGLEDYNGLPRDMYVLGLGGDMVIERGFQLVARPGSTVVLPEPCFSMYRLYARASGARAVGPALREEGEEWRLDWAELLDTVRRAGDPSLVGVDNPNNPTGSLVVPGEGELVDLLEAAGRRGALVVLDEAYYEFSRVSYAELAEAYENLLVIRTLSKAFSLAGLRIGYGIAHPRLAERLRALMPPFLPRPSLAAAAAALRERGYAEQVVETVTRERGWLRERLKMMGYLAYRSHANFILFTGDGAEAIEEKLLERGVAVKTFRLPGDRLGVRVTVGSPRDNVAFVNALAALRGGGNGGG